MAGQEHEAVELARKLRYDLTAMQSKVTELLRMLVDAGLEPLEPYVCLQCGARFRGRFTLAEHEYHSHDGPEPQHWLQAEAKSEA